MTLDMRNAKKALREEVLKLRNSLSENEAALKSRLIFGKVKQLEHFKNSKLIMTYIDFKNEVQTKVFAKECLSMGKRVAVPLVKTNAHGKRELWAVEIDSIDNDLKPGTFGVLEPDPDTSVPADIESINLVIVPGAVFDIDRNRIGYGAGYYDGFLPKLSDNCLKIGVSYEFQIREKLPAESHDVPLDMIITESRII